MASFTIGDTDFLLDGTPHRIIAGAIHYFRVHPDQWADRIRKARLMGLNAIETYVAWNAHEPRRGEWRADAQNDLGRFLDLVAAEGLHAIVRPGPYICAEWHNGGLPVWVTSAHQGRLRSSDPAFLEDVTAYLRRVYDIVAPRQIERGGNVVLVQIENEYGAYGSDKDYLRHLVAVTRDAGITVPLTTVDQPVDDHLAHGTLPELHSTGSFGSRVTERLATLRAHQPTGPLMCSEFWDGWFDWWGGFHHTTGVEEAASELDALLTAGASVSIYMFHGGTNFGYTNGANDKGRYLPIVTSYDYDAPLDEKGDPTAKYRAFREVIARFAPVPDELPPAASAAPAIEAPLEPLGDWIPAEVDLPAAERPATFEEIDHLGPLVRFDTHVPAHLQTGRPATFRVGEVRDFAWVSVDGQVRGTISRTEHQNSIVLVPGETLSLLVEDRGRVNYASRIGESKGLIGLPELAGVPLGAWTATPIDPDVIAARLHDAPVSEPAGERTALRGRFVLDEPHDLFLDTRHWGRGYVYVNGFALGRYSHIGPQETLYIPAPVVRSGENTIVVLELDHVAERVARFVPEHRLGPLEE